MGKRLRTSSLEVSLWRWEVTAFLSTLPRRCYNWLWLPTMHTWFDVNCFLDTLVGFLAFSHFPGVRRTRVGRSSSISKCPGGR
uniref:Uncharacterized protein n=2 Tax=Picea TaxID=3328 RepID=A0A124GMD6_PICGL|nr:hypothetical protein ABT39_MTgene3440 [Picea glauca]QHR92705.1 hypothetical protein Q903MT_gene6753 [Picea sitchensis]